MDGAGGLGGAGRQAGALRAQDRRRCRRATAISPALYGDCGDGSAHSLRYTLFGSAGGTLRLILRCRSDGVLGDIVFDGDVPDAGQCGLLRKRQDHLRPARRHRGSLLGEAVTR